MSFGNGDKFLTLPQDEVIKRVENSISSNNLLGIGGEAKVYSIDGTGYCVRILHENPEDYKKGFLSELSDFEIANHGVMKLGEETRIMKRIDGYSMFPRKETGVTRAMVHSMIDDMPVLAYRKVISQIVQAAKKDAYFDSSGANLIVNPVEKMMTVVDFTPCIECSNVRTLKSLFLTLGVQDGIITMPQQKDRANKILSSVIDDFARGNKPIMMVSNYSFSDFFKVVHEQGLISKAYVNVFLKYLNELKELKYMTMRGVKGYDSQIDFNIKVVKSLIKQLLT